MARDLLFEIGCEDLPPFQVAGALDDLVNAFTQRANALRIGHGAVRRLDKPRRLALVVADVDERQADLEATKVGPPVSAAYDSDGQLTRAGQGFLAGLGLDASELTRVTQEKKKGKPAEYIAAVVREEGQPVAGLLPELLSALPLAIQWPKSMRWGACPQAFARPVHWLLARFGGEVVPVSFAQVESGGVSFGHRFHHPEAVEIATAADYVDTLRARKVYVDIDERRQAVAKAAAEAAAAAHGRLLEDDDLLDEIVQLVEWPVGVLGTFEDEFLRLPREVLITTMKKHQRYFTVLNGDGATLPHFVTIANTEVRSAEVVARGNHRVLRARLKDAEFFYREDQKHSLDDWTRKLDRVTYVDGLGSVGDKVRRVVDVAAWLAEALAPGDAELAAHVRRAAALCKADLSTSMVYEFPELQGFVGAEYARNAGEPAEVATGIIEHYAPRGANDGLPAGRVGAIVSIADRIDSIASLFGLGRIPTGAADPFALRRAAVGLIRIALDGDLRFDLTALARAAATAVAATGEALGTAARLTAQDALVGQMVEFILTRFRHQAGESYPIDVVDAVLAIGEVLEDLPAALRRIEALAAVRATPDFEPIAITFKRVGNILGDTPLGPDTRVQVELFEEDAERALHDAVHAAATIYEEHLAQRRFREALDVLVGLRAPVDTFFEAVLVNAEEETVRRNRHCLLRDIIALFRRYADVRRL